MRPTIPADTYARRRSEFLRRIGSGAAIIPSGPPAIYSNDVEYRYRPDSDFYYLTGIREPNAVAVLVAGKASTRYVLFVLPRDPERELWTGRRHGVEDACERYGADAAYPIDRIEAELTEILRATDRVYFTFDSSGAFGDKMLAIVRHARADRQRTGSGPAAIIDPGTLLHEMRLRKDAAEIDMMREAASITRLAHEGAMRNTRPGQFEYEIEAGVDATFRRNGAVGPAYPTIVASGANATILHYTHNDRRLDAADLILLDAGAELAGYNADVTRTFPVSSRFAPPQRDLYELVLTAQKAAIEHARPGVSYDDPHRCAIRILTEGMISLGLLEGSADDLIEREEYRQYYMHRTSHWLGMDVHDVGSYRLDDKPRTLEPGMVLTVEPGLYVSPDAAQAPAPFRGLGIRIEDDVLITTGGNEVLSGRIPKEIAAIEALRAAAS